MAEFDSIMTRRDSVEFAAFLFSMFSVQFHVDHSLTRKSPGTSTASVFGHGGKSLMGPARGWPMMRASMPVQE